MDDAEALALIAEWHKLSRPIWLRPTPPRQNPPLRNTARKKPKKAASLPGVEPLPNVTTLRKMSPLPQRKPYEQQVLELHLAIAKWKRDFGGLTDALAIEAVRRGLSSRGYHDLTGNLEGATIQQWDAAWSLTKELEDRIKAGPAAHPAVVEKAGPTARRAHATPAKAKPVAKRFKPPACPKCKGEVNVKKVTATARYLKCTRCPHAWTAKK